MALMLAHSGNFYDPRNAHCACADLLQEGIEMSEVVHKAGGNLLRPVSGFASAAAGIAAGATLIVSGNTLAAEAQATRKRS